MKLCKDCEYLYNDMWCDSPDNGFSLVDGKSESRIASHNRKDREGHCGSEAKFFKPKQKPTTIKWFKTLFK